MGLFDIFGKGKSKGFSLHPDIKLSTIDHGSHGDNIGGLIGFNTLNDESGKRFINESMALSMSLNAEFKNKDYELKSQSISDNENVLLRLISNKKRILSAFPYLKTEYTVPFSTKEIIEWSHMGNCEAEIQGGGRNTFGFDFFPTDYSVNKSKYFELKEFQLHVSALALVVDKSELNQNSEVQYSKEFVSYLPSSNLKRQTYYDFIGKVIECKEVKLNNLNQAYIAKVKLINDDLNPDFFTVDMFINKENMRIPFIERDMKISGLLWFQGEMAK